MLLGYAFSAAIQVFVRPQDAAEHLGGGGLRDLTLAMGVGFISSSCSFAALAATRALWTKGASLRAALAFPYASTNLVIELGVLLWLFLGWQFVLALYVGAFMLVAVMVVLLRLTCPAGGARFDPANRTTRRCPAVSSMRPDDASCACPAGTATTTVTSNHATMQRGLSVNVP